MLSNRNLSTLLKAKGYPMAKTPKNHGKSWTPGDIKQLKKAVSENTPTRVLGLKLSRTPAAVQNKASELGISLKPTNQSPYGTKRGK